MKQLQLSEEELERIKRIPRFTKGQTVLAGKAFYFIDSASFLSSYKEIGNREFYRFESQNESPRILDCGANIGLSTIFFKKLHPKARITCFEADAGIVCTLNQNLKSFGFTEVEVQELALWDTKGEISFFPDGADGGRIGVNSRTAESIKVKTDILSSYLQSEVDLLKIDIEGAEIAVLKECSDHLHNVNSLFVEYHCKKNDEINLSSLIAILEENGFRFYIEPGTKILHPFVHHHCNNEMEILLNIFAYKTS